MKCNIMIFIDGLEIKVCWIMFFMFFICLMVLNLLVLLFIVVFIKSRLILFLDNILFVRWNVLGVLLVEGILVVIKVNFV